MNFADRLIDAIITKKSYLCVGLDPQLRYFPPQLLKFVSQHYGNGFQSSAEAIFYFNMAVINATIEFAACYKPQIAFYEKYGRYGIVAYENTVAYLKSMGELVIEDSKREDGGDTAEAYAEGHLGMVDVVDESGELVKAHSLFDVDAMTITGWIDEPVIKPFVEVAQIHDKGLFLLAKTSFKPASRFQEMEDKDGEKGWVKMAKAAKELGESLVGKNGYSSLGVVMGATYPEEAKVMQMILPKAFKLIPGFGFQGGGPDDAVTCFNEDGFGGIVNNSRGTNYAWHPKFKSEFQCEGKYFASAAGKEAQKARDSLNDAVARKNGSLPWS